MKYRKFLLDLLKYLLFLGVGIGLFVWVYRDQKIETLWKDLSGFHYGWIAASLAVSVVSHYFRAVRWRLLIQSIGYKPKISNTFLAILVMYLANYGFTRMGEVARCGILKKYDGVPFTSQLGTVFIERLVDFLFLVLIFFAVLLIDWDVLSGYFQRADGYEDSSKMSFLQSWWFILIASLAVAGGIAFLVFWKRIRNLKMFRKLMEYGVKFTEGLKTVLKLDKPVLFVLLTVGIYGCYFLMTWFVMMGFEATMNLNPVAALSVLAFGSVGMVLPAPGGVGTYHGFVTETLVQYGIGRADSLVLALVLHGSTTILLLVLGAAALAILPVINRKRQKI